MAKRKGSSVSRPRARKKTAKGGSEAREAESNDHRLDKLPPEVWEKILDELESDDLFPLALSCRYFRHKQKELVARPRQKGKPCRALETTLHEWPVKEKPVSAAYLRFCRKEKVSSNCVWDRDDRIRLMAAFHGHLPLLQELLEPFGELHEYIINAAGESSGESSSSHFPLLCSGF